MKKIIVIGSIAVIIMIIYSLYSTENVNSLEGDFQELAFKRNENNTGPVHRVYAYSLNNTLWSEMKKHADLLPHTKYGTTEVYYFLKDDFNKSQLDLSIKGLNQKAQPYCIAYAKIDGQPRIQFVKYPFR